MKSRLFVGYVLAIVGLISLIINTLAYIFIAKQGFFQARPLIIFGLLFCIIGAVMIVSNRQTGKEAAKDK
jgi:uncharacterized integral membrane protein